MSKTFCFGVVALPLIMSLFSDPVMAQATAPPDPAQQQPAQTPAATAPQQQPSAGPLTPGSSSTTTVMPTPPPPPKEPYVLEDGGFYLEPFYWLNKGQPRLRGGLQDSLSGESADLKYNGKVRPAIGFELGIPAGRSNTIRITAFQLSGNGGATIPLGETFFGVPYAAGTFIYATYKVQSVKASWDYLSYTWHKPSTSIHVKTLWEAQYVTTRFNTASPYVPPVLDSSGNNTSLGSGSRNLVLPSFGMALGSEFGKYFRWDVRGSGFGIPRHSVTGDVSALVAVRISHIEIVAGEKFLYLKTAPHADMYYNDTLQGVYGGLRFVWKGPL